MVLGDGLDFSAEDGPLLDSSSRSSSTFLRLGQTLQIFQKCKSSSVSTLLAVFCQSPVCCSSPWPSNGADTTTNGPLLTSSSRSFSDSSSSLAFACTSGKLQNTPCFQEPLLESRVFSCLRSGLPLFLV